MTKVYILFDTEDGTDYYIDTFSTREQAEAEIVFRNRTEAEADARGKIYYDNNVKWYDEYRAIEAVPVLEVPKPVIKPHESHNDYNLRMKAWRKNGGSLYVQKMNDWSRRAYAYVKTKQNEVQVTENQILEALKNLNTEYDYSIREVEVK